jgi:tRNA 2-thiouridine synthesizing protein A
MQEFDIEINLSGLNCPLPILQAKKAITTLNSGQILKVIGTDPGSPKEFQMFDRLAGFQLILIEEQDEEFHYYIKKTN